MAYTSSIDQLQSDWFKFSDLERASAVLAIKQTGISIRSVECPGRNSLPVCMNKLVWKEALNGTRKAAYT